MKYFALKTLELFYKRLVTIRNSRSFKYYVANMVHIAQTLIKL